MDTNSDAVDSLWFQRPKILVAVGNAQVRTSLERVLESYQFQIATAANVGEALHLINAESFDVLLTDWRVTEVVGGFAVVNALQRKNPDALTLVYTEFPELKQALDAILVQSYRFSFPTLPEPIHMGLDSDEKRQPTFNEQVAAILEQNVFKTVVDWLERVEQDDTLTFVPLSTKERIGLIPTLAWELAQHLRSPRRPGMLALSDAAIEQGRVRQSQGYSLGMVVEESRLLEFSIFGTLRNLLNAEDFRFALANAQTITGECEAQLRQTLASFTRQAAREAA